MSTRGRGIDSPRSLPRPWAPDTPEAGDSEQQHRPQRLREEAYLMITEQELARLLAQLGDTPDKVAETLTAAGAAGEPEESASCPVACWLRGKGHEVLVAPDRLIGNDGSPDLRWVPLPEPVQEFVHAFDMGWNYRWLDPAYADLAEQFEQASELAGAAS